MRSTSNPAFRNLPQGGFGGGYAGFQTQPQANMPGYGGYQAPPTTGERPMTVDDVVTKTALTLGVALVTGIITAIAVLNGTISPFPPMIIGMIVGLVLSLIIIFKKTPNAGLVLAYSAAEGVFLGAINPGRLAIIQTGGRHGQVKFIDAVTSAPDASGKIVIPSATAAKADCLAAGTASTYPPMGVSAGAYDATNTVAPVDLNIPQIT